MLKMSRQKWRRRISCFAIRGDFTDAVRHQKHLSEGGTHQGTLEKESVCVTHKKV